MPNIEKLKFQILEMNGANYLSWCLDIELHLQGLGFAESLVVNGKTNEKDKANALIFIHHHLHEKLQVQYLQVRNPLRMWTKLRKMYDHTKIVILPQA